MRIKRKRPILAAFLTFLFGPLGFLYIGFWYMIISIIIFFLFFMIVFFLDIDTPRWVDFVIFAVMAWKAFILCKTRNAFIDLGFTSKKLNSFPLATIAMLDLLVGMMSFYLITVGLYHAIKMIANGTIFKGILIIIGIPFALYFIEIIFGGLTRFAHAIFYKKIEQLNEN